MPLGAVLALTGRRLPRVLLAGVLLSAMIECTQLTIPGRDPSLGDVFSNTVGTLAGALLIAGAAWLVRAPHRATSAAAFGMTALPVVATMASGYLLQPAFPRTIYYGQWTANLGHLEWYRGRVLRVVLDSLPLPSRRLADSERVRSELSAGALLEVRAIAGPRVPALAPLFSIYDADQREIVLVGVDRDDLVLRQRGRAAAWRLDAPDRRLRHVLRATVPGDTLAITVRTAGRESCLTLNGAGHCGIAFTPGHGWTLLLYPESFPAWLMTLLNAAWLGALLLPAGFASLTRRVWLGAGALALTGTALAAPLTGLHLPSLLEWAGAALGLGGGAFMRWGLRRLSPRH